MSVTKIYRLTCDMCGTEEDLDDIASKREARRHIAGWSAYRRWSVNLKATGRRPSLLDTRVDLCPNCRPVREVHPHD